MTALNWVSHYDIKNAIAGEKKISGILVLKSITFCLAYRL